MLRYIFISSLVLLFDNAFACNPLPVPSLLSLPVEDVGSSKFIYSILKTDPTSPVANFVVLTSSCAGLNTVFADRSVSRGGAKIIEIIWNFGDGTVIKLPYNSDNPENNIINHVYATPTQALTELRLEVTVVNELGETNTISKPINVFPSPRFPDAGNPFETKLKCLDATFISDATISDNSVLQYTWDFGDGSPTITTGNVVSHIFPLDAAYTIGLTVKSLNGCEVRRDNAIDLRGYPVADFFVESSICLGGKLVFFDHSKAPNGSKIVAWDWDFGDGGTSDIQNPTHQFQSVSEFTASLRVTSKSGCTSSIANAKKRKVTVFEAIKSKLKADRIRICKDDEINFENEPIQEAGIDRPTKFHWRVEEKIAPTFSSTFKEKFTTAGSVQIYGWAENDNGCRSREDGITVTIVEAFVADFSAPKVCLPNGGGVFTNTSPIPAPDTAGVQYLWNFGNGSVAIGKKAATVFVTKDSYKISHTVISREGCKSVVEKIFSDIYPIPTALFSLPGTACIGEAINLKDNSLISNDDAVTQWSWGFDGMASALKSPSISFTSNGVKDVSLQVTTGVGCKSLPVTKQINIGSAAQPYFIAKTDICQNEQVEFRDSSTTAASAIVKWIWDYGDNKKDTLAAPGSSHKFAATANVSLSVQTSGGCISQPFSQKITVRPTPVADFSFPTICIPADKLQFINQTATNPNMGTLSYFWHFGDSSSRESSIQPLHIYASAGPFDATLIAASQYGCTDTITKAVNTIYNTPTADFTFPNKSCSDNHIIFTDASTGNGSEIDSWQWDLGDGSVSNAQSPPHDYLRSDLYEVNLTVSNTGGCRHTVQKKVIISVPSEALFTVEPKFCELDMVRFADASNDHFGRKIVKWYMDYGDGQIDTSTTGIPRHKYTGANEYRPALQVENDLGCISTAYTNSVLISPNPVVDFSHVQPCLLNTVLDFQTSAHIFSGKINSFTWGFGDGAAGSSNLAAGVAPRHQFSKAGVFTVSLKATSDQGCSNILSKQVNIRTASLNPNFIAAKQLFCANESLIISDATVLDTGFINKVEIIWDADIAEAVTVDDSPASNKSYSFKYPEFNLPVTKDVMVNYKIHMGNQCSKNTEKSVTIAALPLMSLPPVQPFCANDGPVVLQAPALPAAFVGRGGFAGNGLSQNGLFSPGIAGKGLHNIHYQFTQTNGCSNSVATDVLVYASPTVSAGADRVIFSDDSVLLKVSAAGVKPLQYQWRPDTWLRSADSAASYSVKPQKDIEYTVTVTSAEGCSNTDAVAVTVKSGLIIPNIFSPNGDGIHDTWEIENLNIFSKYEIKIFNRYGQMVKIITHLNKAWDGKISGIEAPFGTYYYVLDTYDGRKQYTGWVDIIR